MKVSFSYLREIMNQKSCYRILLFIVRKVDNKLLRKKLPREIGKRKFHPRFNNRSILILGKIHLVVIEMKRNK
jgi:hypothetical protein